MFSTAKLRDLGKTGENFSRVDELAKETGFKHKTFLIQDPVSRQQYYAKDITTANVSDYLNHADQELQKKRIAVAEVVAQNILHNCMPETQPAYSIITANGVTYVMSTAVNGFSERELSVEQMNDPANLKLFGELSVLSHFIGELDFKLGNLALGVFNQASRLVKIDGDYALSDYSERSTYNMNMDAVSEGARHLPFPQGTFPYHWVGFMTHGIFASADDAECLLFPKTLAQNSDVKQGILNGFEKILSKDKIYFLQLCQQTIGVDSAVALAEVNRMMEILQARQQALKQGLCNYCHTHNVSQEIINAYPALKNIMQNAPEYKPAQPSVMRARPVLFTGKVEAKREAAIAVRTVKKAVQHDPPFSVTVPSAGESAEEESPDQPPSVKRERDKDPPDNRPGKR